MHRIIAEQELKDFILTVLESKVIRLVNLLFHTPVGIRITFRHLHQFWVDRYKVLSPMQFQ
jgi:hypothetical protein